MKKTNRFIVPLLLSVIILSILIFFFKSPKLSKENSRKLNGIVSLVDIGGKGDIIVSIEGVRGIQFISNGIKRGIHADLLKKKLINREVTLYYTKPSFWAKLSPVTDTRRITELKLGDETVFSEFH